MLVVHSHLFFFFRFSACLLWRPSIALPWSLRTSY